MPRLLDMALLWLICTETLSFLQFLAHKKENLKFSLQERVLKRPGGLHWTPRVIKHIRLKHYKCVADSLVILPFAVAEQ